MSRLIARFHVAYPGFALDVDLNVPAQGILALFGPSGSGKTTLVRCLAGLERAPNGLLRLGDELWQDESDGIYLPPHRRPIGYVFQDTRLFPHLSVRSNLMYGFNRTPVHQRHVTVDQVVEILGIGHLLDRRPHKLSGGERQRIAIGRALLTSPRLLLLDEPLSSLDTERKQEVLPFIKKLHQALPIPIVYVSHSVKEILQVAHLMALLQRGKLAALGPLSDVLPLLNRYGMGIQNAIGGVIDATVACHEPDFGLTRLTFKERSLHVPIQTLPVGAPMRVHILANDVTLVQGFSLVTTSALNVLEATVVGISDVDQATVNVHLDIGCPLVATITRKSLVELKLISGQRISAHVKTVALVGELTE